MGISAQGNGLTQGPARVSRATRMASLRRRAASLRVAALWPLCAASALSVTGPACFDETHEEFDFIASVFHTAGSIFVGDVDIPPRQRDHCESVMAGDNLHFVVQASEEDASMALAGQHSLEVRADEADGSQMASHVQSWLAQNGSWVVSMAP